MLAYDSMQKDEQNQPRRPSVFKELREAAQLTQEQLAREMGKTLSTIRRWENGDEPKMTREEWVIYCELMNKDFNELPRKLSVPAEVS